MLIKPYQLKKKPYQLMGLHIQLIDKRLNHSKMKTKANKINYLEEKCQNTLLTEANSYQRGDFFLFWC